MAKNILLIVAVSFVVLGCKKTKDAPLANEADVYEGESVAVEETVTLPDWVNGQNSGQIATGNKPPRSRIERGLSFAGMPDIETLERFLSTVRFAAQADDREAIAALVYYPYKINYGEEIEIIETPEQFLKAYDRIISPESQQILETMDRSTFWGNWRGGNIHNGAVWFNTFQGEAKIIYVSR